MQSNQAEITQQSEQKYLVAGIVNFSTVPDLMNRVNAIFASLSAAESTNLIIDFSQITECNSAALAWMLESVEKASLKNIVLKFENLPATLLSIAKAYGVEEEIKRLVI